MKKTIEYKGQLYDVYASKDTCRITFSVYRVKRPNNKRFFRTECLSFCSGNIWFEDLRKEKITIEDGILYKIEKELQSRQNTQKEYELWNEFCEK